jgi:hypothetical protein
MMYSLLEKGGEMNLEMARSTSLKMVISRARLDVCPSPLILIVQRSLLQERERKVEDPQSQERRLVFKLPSDATLFCSVLYSFLADPHA